MEIKKVNLVSREDMEGLVRTLELTIKDIDEGRGRDAKITLMMLRNNIKANLKEDI